MLLSKVLFSVKVTTVVVRAGEAVTLYCSQTGYIRTQWRWRMCVCVCMELQAITNNIQHYYII